MKKVGGIDPFSKPLGYFIMSPQWITLRKRLPYDQEFEKNQSIAFNDSSKNKCLFENIWQMSINA